jgi:hypothetical protein
MTGRIPASAAKLAAALLAVTAISAIAAGSAGAVETVYTNIPAAFPPNLASVGNEAYSNAEIGGQVEFAGTARKNPMIVVGMSSWACQSGHWNAFNCSTTPGATFEWPITFNVYEVGAGNTVGALLVSGTKTFKMPYRPSADLKRCTGPEHLGEWFSKGQCWHGKAFRIRLGMKLAKLPEKAIVSVVYNTTHHGPSPIGESAACFSTEQGCFYDSLNVALTEPSEGGATVGSDPTEAVYVNTTDGEETCGAEGSFGTFAPATCPSFWEGDQPTIEVKAG